MPIKITPKDKQYYEIKAEGKTAKIFIYGEIDNFGFEDSIGAKDFAEKLAALGDIEEINVHINSPGGMVFEGITIYNTLVNHPAKIIVHIDGVAVSIASVIAMAGDEVRIAKNGMMMIHNPMARLGGESKDFRDMADTLDKIKETLIISYRRVTDMPEKVISDLMDKTTWFTAQEAMDSGLVHTVTDAERIAACFDFNNLGIKDIPKGLEVDRGLSGGGHGHLDINWNNLSQVDEGKDIKFDGTPIEEIENGEEAGIPISILENELKLLEV